MAWYGADDSFDYVQQFDRATTQLLTICTAVAEIYNCIRAITPKDKNIRGPAYLHCYVEVSFLSLEDMPLCSGQPFQVNLNPSLE